MGEKLCFCLKLETGCILLGLFTFILSNGLMIFSIITLAFGCHPSKSPGMFESLEFPNKKYETQSQNLLICPFNLTSGVQDFLAVLVLVISTAWMISSVLFIYGALKKKTTYVDSYFLLGVVMSLLFLLSALLEAIKGWWIPSALTVKVTAIYLKCLASVFSAFNKIRQEDQDELLAPDDFRIDD